MLANADRDQVLGRIRKSLADSDKKPLVLTGLELKAAFEREQWRDTGRIAELSAIEFRTIILHRIKFFAKAEKLEPDTLKKLLAIADEQWDRLAKDAQKDKVSEPEEWLERCKNSFPAFIGRVKDVLPAAQLERFTKTLAEECDDKPEAPPTPKK